MHLSDLTDRAADNVRSARTYLEDLATPTVRLGVTGLSRAGKTVFITALVRALTAGALRPPIRATTLPGFRGYLEPQPDDDVPRFGYEAHLAALSGDAPVWPESTRQISQLRLTLEWQAGDWTRQTLGIGRRLHLDIVDYPGEWLVDLALLDHSFETWSASAIEASRRQPRDGTVERWLSFVESVGGRVPPQQPISRDDPEQLAIKGAALYTAFLEGCRGSPHHTAIAGPGRFLMPGDLEGSPLLTFFPVMDCRSNELHQLLKRRFESYKQRVVKPFFENHFSRLDRQIVLVDVLRALNDGPDSLHRLDDALNSVLSAFRPGANTWLSSLMGRRIERILFASTKADLLNTRNHDRLEAILTEVVKRASNRAKVAGAVIGCQAIAALRATEDVEKSTGTDTIPCIRGIPAAGERVSGRIFDGAKPAVIFPGDLPDDPLDAFEAGALPPGSLTFARFQPPRLGRDLPGDGLGGDGTSPWPHIGLGRAIHFLIGDRLA